MNVLEYLNAKTASRPAASFVVALGLVAACTVINVPVAEYAGYHGAAVVYLAAINLLGLIVRPGAVMVAAATSGLLWNFLFIPPRFTFIVGNAEDVLIFCLYLLLAFTSAFAGSVLQKQQKLVRERELAKESERLGTMLLDLVSHEIRSPLTVIKGSASALADETIAADAGARSQLVETLNDACTRLNDVVENLMSMNRLETGRLSLRLEATDLGELCCTALERLRPELGRHGIYFVAPSAEILVEADAGLCLQVMSNLILNVIRHCPAGTGAEIRLERDATTGHFYIADEGGALKDEEIPHLFEKFFRGKGAAPGGTGLGLSISKGIVEAHGGAIRAERNARGGLTVGFCLPLHGGTV